MAFDIKLIPEILLSNLKNKNCSVFVGAGLSIKSGLPSWKVLLEELIAEVEKLPYDTTKQRSDYLEMIKDSNKYLMLASDIKSSLAKNFYDYLERRFADKALAPNINHNLISEIPFQFIITTNYDQLIEKAYAFNKQILHPVLTPSNSRDIAYKIWNNEFFILKAHGDISIRKDEIVMTEQDYREILFKNPGFQSALQVLFSTKSILFVGTSFSDPDFILLMRYLHSAYHGGGPTHYILVNENEIFDVEARRNMEDFNLHTIKYNPENDFEQITQFLEYLKNA
jgi:SIR2-like domain